MNRKTLLDTLLPAAIVALCASIASADPPADKVAAQQPQTGVYRVRLTKGMTWKTDFNFQGALAVSDEEGKLLRRKENLLQWRTKYEVQEADEKGNCKLLCSVEKIKYKTNILEGEAPIEYDSEVEAKKTNFYDWALNLFLKYPATWTFVKGVASRSDYSPDLDKELSSDKMPESRIDRDQLFIEVMDTMESGYRLNIPLPEKPQKGATWIASTKLVPPGHKSMISVLTFQLADLKEGKWNVTFDQEIVVEKLPMKAKGQITVNEKTGWTESTEIQLVPAPGAKGPNGETVTGSITFTAQQTAEK